MLRVDLARLHKKGRVRIDGVVPADAALWESAGLKLAGGLTVGLDVQQTGPDVIVRGLMRGATADSCRRCLRPVECAVEDEVTLVFREGVDEVEAAELEVYAFDEKARELDLGPALREQLILVAARYPLCEVSCRGLCSKCGADLNVDSCDCREVEVDPRWSALREMSK